LRQRKIWGSNWYYLTWPKFNQYFICKLYFKKHNYLKWKKKSKSTNYYDSAGTNCGEHILVAKGWWQKQ